MFIDDVTIRAASGNGGNGAVAFNKNLRSLGPAGGSGGSGGSVFAEGVEDISALRTYRHKKEWLAEDGGDGRGQFVDGKTSEDITLRVPVGTVVHNLTKGTDVEITRVGERILVIEGGRGGKGNFHFRSPVNTSPKEFEEGFPGESAAIRLELKLIADVGLIGLPNAGKSSLLNELTNARAKVGNYAFTTLEPNLGAFYGLILADIPGLIEGASHGKGLGVKFLRHIERTRVLFHLVSAESEDPLRDYRTVRAELAAFNPALVGKPEYVFLSKADTATEEVVAEGMRALKGENVNAFALSIHDEESLLGVRRILQDLQREKGLS
jgi:GTP-binding protein